MLYKQTMLNLEPETEANSTAEDAFPDGSHNTSAISFNEIEDAKHGGLGTDPEMFPNFEQPKAKDAELKKKMEAGSEFTPSESAAASAAQTNLFK